MAKYKILSTLYTHFIHEFACIIKAKAVVLTKVFWVIFEIPLWKNWVFSVLTRFENFVLILSEKLDYIFKLSKSCVFICVCMLCVSNVYGAIAIKDTLSNFGNIAYFEWTKKGEFHLLWILDQNQPPLCKGEMMESM